MCRPRDMTMPVFRPGGLGMVAMRVSEGREVMWMCPSWMPGTAMRMPGGESLGLPSLGGVMVSGHMAKAQKLRALTGRLWRSHGCFLSVVASSMGRILE